MNTELCNLESHGERFYDEDGLGDNIKKGTFCKRCDWEGCLCETEITSNDGSMGNYLCPKCFKLIGTWWGNP